MGIVIGFNAPDNTPSMEAQSKALQETAIAVTERQIAACEAELVKLRADLKAIKQRTGIYAQS